MAILTDDQLTVIRRAVGRGRVIPINYTKAQVNSGLQAIEDWFEVNRAEMSAAIDDATSPFVFTNAQKRELMKYWLTQKSERGG